MRLARRETGLRPPVKKFTDRSKAVLLLWIICVFYVLCLSCFRVCSLLTCGHLRERADLLALVCDVYCDFVTFPFGILGHYVVLDCIDS